VLGLTWWPLFDHIDWNSGLTRLVGHVCPSGLYHLRPTVRDRSPSPLVELFRQRVRTGAPQDLGRRTIPLPALETLEQSAVPQPGNAAGSTSGNLPEIDAGTVS
jgi:beta-glucosidase